MYFVYTLYSKRLDRLYIGQTQNLDKRVNEHRNGLSKFTSRTSDWELIYSENCETRRQAMKRERQLKSHKGRDFLRNKLARGC